MRITPDSYIERHERDYDGPEMSDAEMCAEGLCDHHEHCYECGNPLRCPTEGYCVDCDIRYMASHQLGCEPFPSILQSEDKGENEPPKFP